MTEEDILRLKYQQEQMKIAQIEALSKQLNDSARQLNQSNMQLYQNMQIDLPQVAPVTNPNNNLEWWYCRDVTGHLIRCWQ